MPSSKESYIILGLKKGASKDEIAKRYNIILKKFRSGQAFEVQGERQYCLEEVDAAYNKLMGYEVKLPEDKAKTKPNPFLKMLNIDQKKWDNFWEYHKIHVLLSIIAVFVVFSVVKGMVTRVTPDLGLAFIGAFSPVDGDKLDKSIRSELTDLKLVSVDAALISEKEVGEQAYAMQMKAVVIMAAGDVDVFVVDKKNFEVYTNQGAFIDLANFAKENNVNVEKNKEFIVKSHEDTEAHLYGIDVSGSPLLNDIKLPSGEKKIAAIRLNAKHKENAERLMKLLVR